MARPNKTAERRKELLPIVAQAFAAYGYRRTTTAELAKRCGVRENVLYRLWADKKSMFVAAIEYVYQQSAEVWAKLIRDDGTDVSPAERVLAYEARHYGETGLYRLIYAGLSETDDPDIRTALRHMYSRFHRFVRAQVVDHRGGGNASADSQIDLAAWAIVGLGSVVNVGRELGLMGDRRRAKLFMEMGRLLLDGGGDVH